MAQPILAAFLSRGTWHSQSWLCFLPFQCAVLLDFCPLHPVAALVLVFPPLPSAPRVAPAPNQNASCTTAVITTYSHDALNRLTKISYSDGTTPTVQYGYDGVALSGCSTTPPSLTDPNPKGRLTSMCDGSGATSWSHDAAGRITTEKRIILGVTETLSYACLTSAEMGVR